MNPINKGASGYEANRRAVALTPSPTSRSNSVALFCPMYAPIRVKNRMNGIRNVRGTVRTFAMYGIRGRFRINSTMFPMYMEIITDQKISG